jgi:hypothetical protein
MLGEGGRSYVVGYGSDFPKNIQHRESSCPSTGPCNWRSAYYPALPNPKWVAGRPPGRMHLCCRCLRLPWQGSADASSTAGGRWAIPRLLTTCLPLLPPPRLESIFGALVNGPNDKDMFMDNRAGYFSNTTVGERPPG